jgi:hypothetical protein
MPILPDSLPKIEANAAKVAFAYETLDMIQAEAFIAECAYRRYMASTRPLEVHMTRKREFLEHAKSSFKALCDDHHPRVQIRYAFPVSHPASSFTPTTFPPSSEAGGRFIRG